MHLAAAMNVPGQVVIETPTWNKPIEPYGHPFVLVKTRRLPGAIWNFIVTTDGASGEATRNCAVAWSR